MDKDTIKASLVRLLNASRIEQSVYEKALDKLNSNLTVDTVLTEIESEVGIDG